MIIVNAHDIPGNWLQELIKLGVKVKPPGGCGSHLDYLYHQAILFCMYQFVLIPIQGRDTLC